ncbi:Tolloid-like protein 1 [Elysia marginata]|uniref:Tolloid-like protein 1 n=1 Tax=Elysia marginata TaxID=1093978 RepID=A0AAV4FIM4_9GAST|nr:Tolloid-like protein 1 [Elysia marginata]
MEIYDGENSSSPLLYKLCGRKTPEFVSSSSNVLFTQYVAPSTIAKQGYKFHAVEYQVVERRDIDQQNGTLICKVHHLDYSYCKWNLKVGLGGLDSSVGSGFAPWPRGRGFETQPSTVRAPTGWVGVSIM